MADSRTRPDVVARKVIGSYEVVRKIASGGMGEVYLANQRGPVDFCRQVVLKKLHPRFTSDPEFVTMFLNEARIAASLAHPNIIHIYELFEDGAGYVIAMEYVRGGTVLSVLRELRNHGMKSLPLGPMVRVATSVCAALHYAYNEPDAEGEPRHVIHRDVSPSNVLVGYDGQVKLVDFGIAKVLEKEGSTQATTLKGKYGYLTPEQIKRLPLDERSDIFSLGTMMWEMSVGERLFQRDNEMQMLYAVLEERIPLPSERVPGYPKGLEYVVMKALARERDDRYADASLLAQDLRELARDNDWDSEAAALSRLVKRVLPDHQIAFGRIGRAFDSQPSIDGGVRDSTAGTWSDVDSFASLVVIDPAKRTSSRSWASPGVWVTIMIMLAATAVFWILIVPELL